MLAAALKIAKKSEHSWAKHASIVLQGGAVLSMASNTAHQHAEVRALKNLWSSNRNRKRRLTLWSLRFTRGDSKLANAKPCPDCLKVIQKFGVKLVIYSDISGNLQRMKP